MHIASILLQLLKSITEKVGLKCPFSAIARYRIFIFKYLPETIILQEIFHNDSVSCLDFAKPHHSF